MMKRRALAILTLQPVGQELSESADLVGPLAVGLCLGVLLLLGGKMHFSDIEGGFLVGTGLLYLLLNFMNQVPQNTNGTSTESRQGPDSTSNTPHPQSVSLYFIMSCLGYCLLPMLLLALGGILFPLINIGGVLASLLLGGWCSQACGNLVVGVLGR